MTFTICKIRLRPLIYFLTFVCSIIVCYAQNRSASATNIDPTTRQIMDSLRKMNDKFPLEKVYVHTDRMFYNIGDTIWFKAYLINGVTRKPSNISNRLYLTIADDSLNIIDRISVRIVNGIAWAQLPLRKIQYQEGYYTLWAHTTWMQNFNSYFSRRFYFSPAAADAWLVTSETKLDSINKRSRISVSLKLDRTDAIRSAVALKDVEVKIYDRDRYLFKKDMRTGVDGSLRFTETIADRIDGKRLKAQIISLDPIDTNKILQVPLTIDRSAKIDLQFLPEGGKLVSGLNSVIGFKAVGEDGRGTSVAGDVFDNHGNKVASFRSLHNGMGSFQLTPKAGSLGKVVGSSDRHSSVEKNTARIYQPTGVTEDYPLPKVEPVGTVIHVENTESSAQIKVTFAGLSSIPLDSTITIVGTAGGALRFAQKLSIFSEQVLVDKRAFPTGLVRFTLFNETKPLNERVIFIDHHDQLQVNITLGKPHYRKRDSVSLTIDVKDKNGDPVAGRFSLAVTDDKQVMTDTLGDLDITTGLLLNSNLKIGTKGKDGYPVDMLSLSTQDHAQTKADKLSDTTLKTSLTGGINGLTLKNFSDHLINGEIESSGYYIHRVDKSAWEALDNLMLTQAWSDHSWKDVFSNKKKIAFKAQNTDHITGKVLNVFGKPVPNIPVWIYLKIPALDGKEMTDSAGMFTFKNLLQIDTATYFFHALKPNLKPLQTGELDIDRPNLTSFYPFFNYPIRPWYVNPDSTMVNMAKLTAALANANKPKITGTVLKEVKIRDRKIIKGSYNEYGPGNADYIFDEGDIKRSGLKTLYDFLLQNIPGLRISGAANSDDQPIVMFRFNGNNIIPKLDLSPMVVSDMKAPIGLEKRPVDYIEELSKFDLEDIKGIELTFSNKYTHGRQPTMAITSKSGVGGYKKDLLTANFYRPVPTTAPKLFYSPKYRIQRSKIVPDHRPTIYWDPNVITDKNGRATVTFYKTDTDGGFTVNVQGMSPDGRTGSSWINVK